MLRNMHYNIAAVAVLLLVLIFFRVLYKSQSKPNKIFQLLIISIMLTAISNLASDYLLHYLGAEYRLLCYHLYSIYLIFINVPPLLLTCYIDSLIINSTKNKTVTAKVTHIINIVIFIIHAVLSILNISLHEYVYLDNSGLFEKGPLYVVIYLVSGYYLIFSFVKILRYSSYLGKKQVCFATAFVIITFGGALLQFFVFNDVMVIYFIYTLSIMILLFSFETPDYKQLLSTTKSLEESQEQLKKAKDRESELNHSIHRLMRTASWILYFNEDGTISEANWSSEFLPMLGYNSDDFKGDLSNLWADSLHPDDKEQASSAFIAGLSGKPYHVEARIHDKDGNYKWYLCTGSLDKDENGKIKSYQGIIQDINDEKIKQELSEQRLKAMEELEKSQAELQKALFDAREANNAKTTFLSNMSHDIRTPMNSIIGFTQLAMDHLDDRASLEEYLQIIKNSGDHLLSLINDVLDMSRIESGKVHVEAAPCNLREMLTEIGHLSQANIKEHNHTYTEDFSGLTDDYVICDRLRINQVLINCVGNAIKYTPDGGKISLTVSESPAVQINSSVSGSISQNDSSAQNAQNTYDITHKSIHNFVFRIKDNGIGMSESFVKKIFEPFERAQNSTASKVQGTGLGMAITKNLVDMMQGKIEVESTLGSGSEFIITLPLEVIDNSTYHSKTDEAGKASVSVEEMEASLKGKRFLVVDDNMMNRKLVRKLLTQRGMEIEECESGSEAAERLKNITAGEFDMVFMDIQMPGMDGYATTDLIRSMDNPVLKNIPIIAMTANAFEEDKQRAKAHGMNGHVTKPFKINALLETLYEHLIKHNTEA